MTDPGDVLDAMEDAHDAFEFRTATVDFENGVDQDDSWKTQLTKACRYSTRAAYSVPPMGTTDR